MKTIYSMQEFYEKVGELASIKNQTYYSVEVEINSNKKVLFGCYVSGCGIIRGDTIEECLQNLKDKICGEEIKDIDVNVEVEHEHANQ